MFSLMNRSKIYVKKFSSEDATDNFALLSFKGKVRDELVEKFTDHYRVEGDHIEKGGKIAPRSLLTLLGTGGGALGLSAAMSGQLFMATANPATLMAIGGGVGSAVMGATGIVAQAPFIALAGAIVPVVAPLLAFQAISTIMIMNQFKAINERLNHIEKTLKTIIQREEAGYIGQIISAASRLENLYHEYHVCNEFTFSMIIRLSLVEDAVNPIFERYSYLYHAEPATKAATREELQFKRNDGYFAIIASIVDLRIDLLRLRLRIQENPGYIRHAAEQLRDKVGHYQELWKTIGSDPSLLESVSTELRKATDDMSWWQKTMPGWLRGKRAKRKDMEKKAGHFGDDAKKSRDRHQKEIEAATRVGEAITDHLEEPEYMNLVYWKDGFGEHSYYTNDLEVIPA